MIQRQQSLWLLLSTICGFLTFKLPFFAGGKDTPTSGGTTWVQAGSSFFLIVLTAGCIILSLATIFLYKDRKLQLKLCYAGIAASVLIIIFYFVEIKGLPGAVALSAIFALAIPVGFVMAARCIWKDEKLVKSLDKLR
jgi:Domain of unknown function (DUF4293)